MNINMAESSDEQEDDDDEEEEENDSADENKSDEDGTGEMHAANFPTPPTSEHNEDHHDN
jgi:hypothetical protein